VISWHVGEESAAWFLLSLDFPIRKRIKNLVGISVQVQVHILLLHLQFRSVDLIFLLSVEFKSIWKSDWEKLMHLKDWIFLSHDERFGIGGASPLHATDIQRVGSAVLKIMCKKIFGGESVSSLNPVRLRLFATTEFKLWFYANWCRFEKTSYLKSTWWNWTLKRARIREVLVLATRTVNLFFNQCSLKIHNDYAFATTYIGRIDLRVKCRRHGHFGALQRLKEERQRMMRWRFHVVSDGILEPPA